MKTFLMVLCVLLFSQVAAASGVFEWKGKPSVFIVGSGTCAKAVCMGIVIQEVTPFSGPNVITRLPAICGAKPGQNGAYTCPPGDECMDEKTPGIAPGKFEKIEEKEAVIIENFSGSPAPEAGAAVAK